MDRFDNSELDRLIEDAVVENAARKRLQTLENTIQEEEAIRRKECENGQRKDTGTPEGHRTRKLVLRFAVAAVSVAAAVVAIVLISSFPTAEQVQRGIELSERYITNDETYREIGTSEIDLNLQNAASEMRNGDTEEALAVLEDILKSIDGTDGQTSSNDRDFIDRKNLEYARATAEWYIALAYLNQGKLAKAKPMLKAIRKSGSHYADDAARMLDDIFR